MDDSVIFIEEKIEIIDLSESICDDVLDNSVEYVKTYKRRGRSGRKCDVRIIDTIDLTDNKFEVDISKLDRTKVQSLSRRSWDLSCPICLDKFCDVGEVKITVCGHIFCKICIKRAIINTKRCPMCRTSLDLNDLILVKCFSY